MTTGGAPLPLSLWTGSWHPLGCGTPELRPGLPRCGGLHRGCERIARQTAAPLISLQNQICSPSFSPARVRRCSRAALPSVRLFYASAKLFCPIFVLFLSHICPIFVPYLSHLCPISVPVKSYCPEIDHLDGFSPQKMRCLVVLLEPDP